MGIVVTVLNELAYRLNRAKQVLRARTGRTAAAAGALLGTLALFALLRALRHMGRNRTGK